MFEGKHIHFSPADNKPLCSYSSKLCRQRRLNGYAFCIRHILEDKSAPFKRCTYVTRNNNQICQNAIPTSQVSRGYCHSHMQVAGIIPKTERKVKNPPPPKPVDSLSGSIKSVDSNSNSSNSNNSSNSSSGGGGAKKDPNAVFKFEDEEQSEIQWIPKGGRINGIVNGRLSDSTTTPKDSQTLSTTNKDANGGIVLNGRIPNGNLAGEGQGGGKQFNPLKKVEGKNGKLQNLTNGSELSEKDKDSLKSRETFVKRPSISTKVKKEVIIETGISSPTAPNPPSSKGKQTSSRGRSIQDCDSAPVASLLENTIAEKEPLHCIPEHGKFFDQLKTLKSVEKSVSLSKTADSSFRANTNNKPTNSQTILRTISTIPKLQQPSNQRSSQQQQKHLKIIKNSTSTLNIESCISNNSSTYVDLFNSVSCAQKGSNSSLPFSLPNNIIRKFRNGQEEKRQEFLARVRETFKSQYLTIKRTSNHSDNNEKIWKRALRNSLLTCVLKDVSYCAHVIVQNDPKKYADSNPNISEVTNGKKFPATTFKPKIPDTTTPTTATVNNGKCKQGKNGLVTNTDALVNSNTGIPLNNSANFKGNPKESKRSPTTDLDIKPFPARSKKKPKKITDLLSTTLIINGLDGSISESSSTSSQSSTSAKGPSSHIIKRSTSSKKSAPESSLDGIEKMNAKKRKFDMLNGSDHSLGPLSPFRIPKVEDSSHMSTDIDIKLENGGHGQMVFNNYNGHISSHHHHHHRHHHPLLHPHSGSATTATANNKASNLSNAHQVQLQHLLSQPDLRSLATASGNGNCKNGRNQGINTVLNSVGPSDLGGNSDGVITDASFDSTFEHSVSSQQDCDFSDDDLLIDPENDDLEKSLEFQIDPETEHQASRLLEDNELTEDDLNELFPETSNKIGRSADLSDLGVDFSSAFDANDIDYSLFANIFPFASRSNQSESISISNQY